MLKPRILVIRGGAIGDFILTLPAIGLLREAFPLATIEILGYRHIIALAEGRRYADSGKSIEYGPLAGFFSKGGALAPALVEYFSSFQQIVSYLYDPDGIFEANVRLAGVKHFLAAFRPIDDSEHAAYQLASPLQQLALYLEDNAPGFFPTEGDQLAAARFLEASGFEGLGSAGSGKLVAIHPGSGGTRKNWPLERWEVLGRAVAKRGARLLLVGGEADQAALLRLAEAWHDLPVRIADGLPLPELGALFGRCTLFLGHDSGISHLAGAAGVPCVLLFGPTDPAIWAPANKGVEVIQAPGEEMGSLSLEQVLERVEGRL